MLLEQDINILSVITQVKDKKYPILRRNYTSKLNSVALVRKPSDRRFSAKLVPTFPDRGRCVVSATDPHGR
jgi:hypothetical protein